MAKPTEHTTKFNVDISELKAGITQANREMKLLNAEFKEASAGMDDWDKSTDGISAKLKQLNGVLKIQKSVLSNYEQQLALVEEEQGANSKAAQDLRVKILNQKAAIKKTESEIGDYNDRMKTAEKAQKKAAKTGKTVAEEFDNIEKEAEDAGESVQGLSGGFTVMRGTIANLLASGIKNVISGIGNAIEETKEWRKEMSYLEANAKDAGYGINYMNTLTKDVAAITGDAGAAVEGMSNIMASGVTRTKDITDGLMGAAIKWKDTLKFEGLADGLQETLAVGEATGAFGEMLERSGISLEKWNKGLKEAAKNGEEENYILQTMADAGLYDVKEAYEDANGAMIDAARAELDFTDNMSKLAEKAEPIQTAVKQGFADILGAAVGLLDGVDFGAVAAAIQSGFQWFIDNGIPAIKTGIGWIIENVGGLISLIDWEAISAAIQTGFDWFINTAIPAIQAGWQWILDNKDALVAGFIAIATAVGAYMAYQAAINLMNGGWKSLAIVQKAVTAGQWLMNAAMSANPIGIVIAAVAALVAAFIYLWNNCEGFREFWLDLWEKVQAAAAVVAEWFSEKWAEISAWFSEMWTNFSTWASNTWTAIQETWNAVATWFNDTVVEPLTTFFSDGWENISTWASDTWTAIQEVWNTVSTWFNDNVVTPLTDFFSDGWGNISTWAADTWKSIQLVWTYVKAWFTNRVITPVTSIFSDLWGNLTSWASDAWTSIKTTFKNVSTWFGSKFSLAWATIKGKFAAWGEFWSGLWTTIKDKFTDIGTSIGSAISDAVVTGINAVLATIEGIINSGINLINSAISLANMLPGVNVGHIETVSLPRLAQGGYIGPNRPTAAIIGDNKHAGEIVAPEDKLLEVMKRALSEFNADGVRAYDPHSSTAANGGASGRSMNFYQYNSSPKPLSRLEIYRLTQNQLMAAAGVK